ncbi:uncharacterized protein LOC143239110 [Tachypleus tridentatus]|uniref:uncharacterized protein LOC143239110 n=1 Tax=Tachypleus tridentatus TaxID=6853 RepID=UPI003FD5C31A
MTLKEAVTMVMKHSNGVSTLAFCIMSNSRKSRLLALQLLTTVCQASFDGNEMVLEAMTSLQLAYGESVRFKFMVSMLKTETRNSADFKFAVLVLINTIILRTRDLNQKVRLQCEFKKAGLNISKLEEELFEKTMPGNDGIWKEISKWKERYLNVENIMSESQKMVSQIKVLKNEVKHLHEVNEKLETQKRSLMRAEIKKLDMTEISESYCTEIKSPHQYSVDIIECGHPDNDKILIDVPTLFSSKKNLQAVPKLPHPVTVDNSPQEKYCLSSNYAKSDNTLKVTKNIHPVPIFNYNTSLEKKPTYQFTTPSTQCFDNVNRSSVMTGVNNGSCFKTTGITGTYEYGRNAALSKCIRDSERQSIVSNSSDVRFISKRSFSLYLHSPSSCQDDINVQEELIRPVFKTSFLRDNYENKRFIKSNHH